MLPDATLPRGALTTWIIERRKVDQERVVVVNLALPPTRETYRRANRFPQRVVNFLTTRAEGTRKTGTGN